MAHRFYASPYKNQVAQVAKREAFFSEIPVSKPVVDSSNGVKSAKDYALVNHSNNSVLTILPYERVGKFGQRAPSLNVGGSGKHITDFDASFFDDLVACGYEDGVLSVAPLPESPDPEDLSTISPSVTAQFKHTSSKAVENVNFHPTSSNLLLSSSVDNLSIWDVNGSNNAAFSIPTKEKAIYSAVWSQDGTTLLTTGTDAIIKVWDPRADFNSPVISIKNNFQPIRPSRIVSLKDGQIFSTGFTRLRERQIVLFDLKTTSTVKTKTIDTSTGAIIPVVDQERNIVYLGGRGDMTLRWVEIGGPPVFTEGAAAVPSIISGINIAPRNRKTIDVMQGEINKILISTSDAVIPVTIQVPKRQYLDFHFDIFPDIKSRHPAQDSKAWLQGANAPPLLESQDPSKAGKQTYTPVVTPSLPKPTVASTAAPVSTPTGTAPMQWQPQPAVHSAQSAPIAVPRQTSIPHPAPPAIVKSSEPSRPIAPSPQTETLPSATTPPQVFSTSTVNAPATVSSATPTPIPAQSSVRVQTASSLGVTPPAATSNTRNSSEPFNPTWSRKFLSGKTPLKVDYDDLKGLSNIASPDASLFKSNTKFFAFPLSGPGGKVGVHSVAKMGRLPTLIPSVTTGAGVSDFEWDRFEERTLWVACDDGKIRGFEIPEEGLDPEQGDLAETKIIIEGGMDKVQEIRSHPTIKGLLLSLSHDRGNSQVTVWKTSGEMALRIPVNDGRGVFCVEWSPDGKRIAVVTKDRVLRVFDPRNPNKVITGKTHDSPRVVRVAWFGEDCLITTGFSRSANRELILYKIQGDEVEIVDRLMLDVSPAVLFPYTDWDTKIVFAFSRGERTLYCFEAQPDTKPHLFKLPSFDHGTLQSGWSFLPKLSVDVKKVEILKAFRLTPTSIQTVSFTIPRAKVEFFQNDIYILTPDTSKPILSTEAWLGGENKERPLINMQPEGMRPVSDAPESKMVVNTRAKIAAGPVITESQKQEEFMNRLFKMAKDDDDGEEIRDGKVVPKGTPLDDDDDW